MRAALALCLALAMSCGDAATPPPGETTPDPALTPQVKRIGVIADPAGASFGRDGCASGPLGGRILYTFGDTLFFKTSVDGKTGRSNTAAYADVSNPTVVTEPLDANGLPAQFIPFTTEEQAYNDATGKGDDRYVIWPGKIVPRPGGQSGLAFFNYFRAHPDHWEGLGTGVAEVQAGATVAVRLPKLVFQAPEPDFTHATFEKDGVIYLYACEAYGFCRVAKAPLVGATERANYTFWDGEVWTPDLAQAQVTIPGSTSGFSVAYNAYLGAYVSFSSAGFGNTVRMRVARHPEGPWSGSIDVYTFPTGAIYATGQHTALDADGGRRIYVSAYNDFGNFKGEIVLLELTLTK
ncbi:MAG TPA: DUF4185 domain-containing protein [Polyangiaceae bacterium]